MFVHKSLRVLLVRKQWYHNAKNIKTIFEGERKWVSSQFKGVEDKVQQEEKRQKKHRSSIQEFYSEKPNSNKEQVNSNNSTAKLVRLDQAISQLFGISRQYALFLIENGHVKRNGIMMAKKSDYVSAGDKLDIFLQARPPQFTQQTKGTAHEPDLVLEPSDILFEDEHILVINKPAGYAVHAGPGNPYHSTVICAIREYVKQTKQISKLPIHVGIAHRLDKDTSGVLICGKNTHAVKELSAQFQNTDACKKLYCAVCTSSLPNMENLPIFKKDAFIDDDEDNDMQLGSKSTSQNLPQDLSMNFAEDDDEYLDMEDDWYKEQLRKDEKILHSLGEYEHLQVQNKQPRNPMLENIKSEIIIDQPIATLPNYMYTMGANDTVDEEIAHKVDQKNAKSIVRIIDVNEQERILLAVVKIMTGRTHQVRSHLASISLPVLGDMQYTTQNNRIPLAVAKKLYVRRMQLHCRQISFIHPITGKTIKSSAPLPPDMKRIVERYFASEQSQKLVKS